MVCSSQHWASISTACFTYSLATFIKQSHRTSPAQGKGTELNVSHVILKISFQTVAILLP